MADELIEARRFQVVDDEGNVRAFSADDPSVGVALNLLDSGGNPRVSLGVNESDIPTFGLHDADGTVRVDISSGTDGQIVRLNDEDGMHRATLSLMTEFGSAPALMLMDDAGMPRVQLQLNSEGLAIVGFNDEGGET